MKSITLALLLTATSVHADTDYTSVDRCLAQGMSWGFCKDRSSYRSYSNRVDRAEEDRKEQERSNINYECVYRKLDAGSEESDANEVCRY